MVDVESQTQLFLKALLSYNFVIRKFARKTAQSYIPWNEHVSQYFCRSYELHDVQKSLFAVPTEIDSLGDTFTSVDFTRILFVQLVSQWRNEIVKQIARKLASVTGPLGHIRDLKQRERRCPERHEVRYLAWWNPSVSPNETGCVCFNPRCANFRVRALKERKCHFPVAI